MMFSFSRSEKTNDLILDSDLGFSLARGSRAVGAALDSIVKTVRGELSFDTLQGVPYFTTVFQGTVSLPEWEEEMRTAIRSCPHVTEIVSFETEVDTDAGVLTYRATVDTDEGEETVVGTLGNGHWSVTTDGEGGDIAGYVLGDRTEYRTDATAFSINIVTAGSSFSIRVRTYPGASVTVSWGDGSVTSGVSSESADSVLTHQYAKNGVFTVEISSGIRRFAIGATDLSSDPSKPMLTAVDVMSRSLDDMGLSFAYCTNLVGAVPQLPTGVTDMSGCFKGCTGLTGSVPSWGPSVTDVSYCYYGCTGLTGIIPEWGSDITDAEACYYGCTGLTGVWTQEYRQLMPDTITSHHSCVLGCSAAFRSYFRYDWGGTINILPTSTYGDLRLAINWYTTGTPLAANCDGKDMVNAANAISTTVVIALTDPVSQITKSVRSFS